MPKRKEIPAEGGPSPRLYHAIVNARVNGGEYRDPGRPLVHWRWPQATWLRRRLSEIRGEGRP
ncbi:MAG TPA: hypothetical protein VGA73_18130 [Candidatus Binatia bacterium]